MPDLSPTAVGPAMDSGFFAMSHADLSTTDVLGSITYGTGPYWLHLHFDSAMHTTTSLHGSLIGHIVLAVAAAVMEPHHA